MELNNICFRNIGKNTFCGGDLYFYKGEDSSEELFFAGVRKDEKRIISLEEDLEPLKESKGHTIILRMDEQPLIGRSYYFNIYIKSDKKEIRMKNPLKIIINIINEKIENIILNDLEEEKKEEKLKNKVQEMFDKLEEEYYISNFKTKKKLKLR